MEIKISREQYDDIENELLNHVYSSEEWDPDKGMLFLQCEEDMIVADVLECQRAGQGRWLIVFNPLGIGTHAFSSTPISESLREVPQRPKRSVQEFAKAYTKPWHGYYL